MPAVRHARIRSATAALACAMAWSSAVVAVDVAVDVQREDDVIVVRASALVDADAARAWQVLTDYARYPQFVPGLRTSRIVTRNGVATTVEQTGSATLGFVRLPLAVVYDIVETPPVHLQSRGIIANVGTLDSGYTLEPMGTKLKLDYVGRLKTWSALLRPFAQASGKQTLADQFRGLADEIERRHR